MHNRGLPFRFRQSRRLASHQLAGLHQRQSRGFAGGFVEDDQLARVRLLNY